MKAPAVAVSTNVANNHLERTLKDMIVERLATTDCVALLGPRQVGKTTLARKITEIFPGSLYLDLQSPKDICRLGDGEAFFANNSRALIVLDEIQCKPELFAVMRSQIDERRLNLGPKRGSFLILGSASLDLRRGAAESLAGRISELFLPGFQLGELIQHNQLTLETTSESQVDLGGPVKETEAQNPAFLINDLINPLWLRGGFPLSYSAEDDVTSLQWRRDFLQTYIQNDINGFGLPINGRDLRRFWELLATRQGELWVRNKFAVDLGLRGNLIDECKNALESLFFIRELQPWHENAGKRLIKSPRYYIRDSGLLHALLNMETLENVIGHEIVGKSWEGFVIEALVSALPNGCREFFYRDRNQTEIDLVLEFPKSGRWAIEIKLSEHPDLTRGAINAAKKLDAERRIVVHRGPDSFTMDNGFEAMTLLDAYNAVESA